MAAPRLAEDRWLGERLGKPAYHVVGGLGRDASETDAVRAQLAARPLFADVKLAADDDAAAQAAQKLGFTLADTNLRFELARNDFRFSPPAADIGFAAPDMIDSVGSIAERSFVHDRFHRDPDIPRAAADRIKRDWARNFFSGQRGEWMVVARCDSVPAGFLQLLRSAADDMVIDLIAVDAAYRGRGLARAMIAFASANCDCAGPVIVGTQVANIPSVRLYETLGFRLAGAQYVFHHHGTAAC